MVYQEMDSLAGDSCYKYARTSEAINGDEHFVFVTASIDSISFCSEFSTRADLRLTAYPIWHGRSALMTTIDIESREAHNLPYTLLGHAIFILVSRRQGKSVVLPTLDLTPTSPTDADDLYRA